MKFQKLARHVRTVFLAFAATLFVAAQVALATDRYWSGNGGSDNISDSNNWFGGNPSTGDNLNWNNTSGTHHFAYFNYGNYYQFGNISFYNGAGGGQLYGNALKFTDYLQNNNDPNQWRIYNSNVSETVSSGSTFYIISNGGGLYFKLDGSGGTGSGSTGSLFLDYNLEVQGGSATTFENVIANGSNGAKGVTITNTSTTSYAGLAANTYTGTTTVSAGTLNLNKASAGLDAIAGNLTINGGALTYGSSDNQITDGAKVTLTSGSIAFGGRDETIGSTGAAASGFAMTGGTVTQGSGTIMLANSASMSGGSYTMTAGGTLTLNTEFNFSGGTIDFTSTSGTPVLNLRGGSGSGITYSSSGLSTAQITNTGGVATISLNQASSATTVFTINDSPTVATEMSIAPSITGAGKNLQKAGGGVLLLSGASTYTGTTTISGGTLNLDSAGSATARLGGTSGITVGNSGTVLLSNSTSTISIDRIKDTATISISGGGTFNSGGLAEGTRPTNSSATNGAAGMGALTLSSTSGSYSTIDFTNSNGSTLAFNSLASSTPTYLKIMNWTGTAGTDNSATTNDRLLFASNTNLTTANLANWQFYNDSGTAYTTGGLLIAYGNMFEIVPVPEPGTWAAGALTLAVIGYSFLVKRGRVGRRGCWTLIGSGVR